MSEPPSMTKIFEEPWTYLVPPPPPPPPMTQIFLEIWGEPYVEPPSYKQLFAEPWKGYDRFGALRGTARVGFKILTLPPVPRIKLYWPTAPPSPPAMSVIFTEPWSE